MLYDIHTHMWVEKFFKLMDKGFKKNHGSLRESVLSNKHEWNTIPHGRRAQRVFLYAILGLAQDVNLIGSVLIHIWNFPMNIAHCLIGPLS